MIGKSIGKYHILDELGKGGMGIVYLASDEELNRNVALKMLFPEFSQNEVYVSHFKKEALALAALTHPNIVVIYDMLNTGDGLVIAMEFLQGETLAKKIAKSNGLVLPDALPLFKQILDAFSCAHKSGIIHRDIKPANVFLSQQNDRETVKVMDFGLAKIPKSDGLETTVTSGGTVHYKSPEQIRDLSQVDHRSDIYSLGMTLYEMLTGRTPFDKNQPEFDIEQKIVHESLPSPNQFRSGIPGEISGIVMKALEKEPGNRFQHIDEMLQALETAEATITARENKKSAAVDSDSDVDPYKATEIPDPADVKKWVSGSDANRKTQTEPDRQKTQHSDAARESSTGFRRKKTGGKKPVYIGIGIFLVLAVVIIAQYMISPNGRNYASLYIDSVPQNADVFLNETPTGKTPFCDENLTPGTYSIKLTADGFTPWDRDTVLQAGTVFRFQPNLQPIVKIATIGKAKIQTTPAGATVYFDAQKVGETPCEIPQITPGAHTLRIQKSGYRHWQKEILFEALIFRYLYLF